MVYSYKLVLFYLCFSPSAVAAGEDNIQLADSHHLEHSKLFKILLCDIAIDCCL